MNIEERLRSLLTDERLALPAWPDPVARIEAGIARRRLRWRRLLGAGLTVLVALAIPAGVRLAAAPADEPPGPTIAPWLDLAVTELLPTPSPRPAARDCTSADLSPEATYRDEGAGSSTRTFTVRIANAGPSRCSLTGSVRVTATDAENQARGTLRTEKAAWFEGQFWEYPATVDPGEVATLGLVTATGCDGGAAVTRYRDVTVEALGREYPLPGLVLETSCPVRASDWFRELFEPGPRFTGLTVGLTAPTTARPGQPYEFTVTLTNTTDAPIAMPACPAYQMLLFKSGGSYRLNCDRAPIAAHASVTFAMRIALEEFTPLGETALSWRLADYGSASPTATAKVVITS